MYSIETANGVWGSPMTSALLRGSAKARSHAEDADDAEAIDHVII